MGIGACGDWCIARGSRPPSTAATASARPSRARRPPAAAGRPCHSALFLGAAIGMMPPSSTAGPAPMITHDTQAALDRLMRFLAVEGVTGQEKAIAEDVAKRSWRPASRPKPSPMTTRTRAFPSPPRPATSSSRSRAAAPSAMASRCCSPPISTRCRSAPAPRRASSATRSSPAVTRPSVATIAPAAPFSSRSRRSWRGRTSTIRRCARVLRARGERPLGRPLYRSRHGGPRGDGLQLRRLPPRRRGHRRGGRRRLVGGDLRPCLPCRCGAGARHLRQHDRRHGAG
jgi:hypothetical protein